MASTDDPLRSLYHDLDFRTRALHQQIVDQLVKVSDRLKLSLSTGSPHRFPLLTSLKVLRFLHLQFVTLLPGGGQRETVLQWITQHLRLDRIELRALEDVCDQRPWLLLHPDSPEWTSDAHRDGGYKDAMVRFALRQSADMPPLSPSQYLRRQSES